MKAIFHTFAYTLMGASLIFSTSCNFNKSEKKEIEEEAIAEEAVSPDQVANSSTGPIKVVTKSMEFITQDEMPSGWITLRYQNDSNDPHFLTMEKYPEGKGLEDAENEVVPVFDEGMRLLIEGKNDEAMAEFGKFPAWFQEVEFYGGVGLTSPKTTSQATFKVEPGTYIIECYVKNA